MEPGEISQLVWAETKYGTFRVWSKDGVGRTIIGDCAYEDGDKVYCPNGKFWDGPLLLPFYDRWARADAWAIDIGAFYGQSTVYLAKGCAGVISVEPIHYTRVYDAISANAVADKVIVIPEAAYSRNCQMILMPEDVQGQSLHDGDMKMIGNLGGLGVTPAGNTPRGDWPLDMSFRGVELDTVVSPEVDVCLIKVDAQGSDLHALIGLNQTIQRCRPAIIFEFEKEMAAHNGHTWETYRQFFYHHGYELTEQTGIGYPGNFVALPSD